MTGLDELKQALSDELGPEHVRDGDSERDLHAEDLSFHAPPRPDLVVYPGSRASRHASAPPTSARPRSRR